mmetsp:Transcript_28139/g.97335  ORF Transcript_28139/g.97335 Transcript_28139/m.97335 type:complete len:87 (+) Transcript_28139:132-392(+)
MRGRRRSGVVMDDVMRQLSPGTWRGGVVIGDGARVRGGVVMGGAARQLSPRTWPGLGSVTGKVAGECGGDGAGAVTVMRWILDFKR